MKRLILVLSLLTIISIGHTSDSTIIIGPDYRFNQPNYDNSPYRRFLKNEKGVALALSGGGARGFAQIGALEVLNENDIPIKFVAGTSMGAILGGLYCAGYSPEELHRLALSVNWPDLFSSAPIRSSILVSAKGRPEKALVKIGLERWRPVVPRGITSGQKLSTLLTKLCYRGGVKSTISFDLLNPPFRAIAADLATGELEVISNGDLAEAMRASMAFPIGFTPVVTNGHLFADGGLLNPIPVDLCWEIAGGPVIAINTTAPLLPVENVTNAIDMVNQSTTVMSLNKLKEQLGLADVVITPDIGFQKTFDFKNIEKAINAGRMAAIEQLPYIQEALKKGETASDRRFKISETEITGLKYMPKTFFLTTLYSGDTLTESEIKNNLAVILRSGYIISAKAELLKQSEHYRINYILQDNPRISGFSFSGLTLFSPQTVMNNIKSNPGQVANLNALASDIKWIEKLYTASGYTLASVEFPRIDQNGTVSFYINEGRINHIGVKGNSQTRDWVIMRDFHLHTGDIFTVEKAQQSLNDLYATGLFSTVKLTALPCSSGVDLIIKVEEKSFDYVRAGIRYDNEYKSAGFVDLVGDNIFGTGNEVYLSGQFGEKKRGGLFNIKADRIFKTYLTYHLTFSYSIFERNHYIDHDYSHHLEEEATGVEFEIGQQFPRLGKLSAALNLSRHINDNPDGSKPIDKTRTSLSIRSLVDTFNSLPIPESGKLHYFDLEFANDVLGGEMVYTRFYTSIEAYYPLYGGLNFHPRAELGFFNRTPPYFRLFSLGGRNSFYGLYEHELTGEKIFNGSMELRQRITGYLYTAVRYDFGEVWNKLQSIRFDQLQHGFGGSLILKTLIGPVGIAYGRTTKGQQAVYFYAGYDY